MDPTTATQPPEDAGNAAATAPASDAAATIEALTLQLKAKTAEAAAATAAFRRVLTESDPTIPPELVAGETVEQIEASIASAKAIVARIREATAPTTTPATTTPATQPPPSAPHGGGLTAPGWRTATAAQRIAAALHKNGG